MKRRLITPFRVLAGGAVVLLSACGTASGTQSGATVVNLGTTNWATIPTVPVTEPTIPESTLPPVPGDKTTTIQEYELKAGDNPTSVASAWGISLQELNEVNAGTSGYDIFFVGLKIKIPVGATIPSTGTETGDTVPPVVTEICGDYTLLPGDFPKVVADKFHVTVKALDAANEDTNGYGGFIVGTKIKIPCAEDASSG
ncbi:MAG: LysM peptidoglycan-binding domain-containing protein [Actinomycetia bacterium]|nr:LysM peptidoglycan-binding domain-containing protein [Actinomycetes bacterium]